MQYESNMQPKRSEFVNELQKSVGKSINFGNEVFTVTEKDGQLVLTDKNKNEVKLGKDGTIGGDELTAKFVDSLIRQGKQIASYSEEIMMDIPNPNSGIA